MSTEIFYYQPQMTDYSGGTKWNVVNSTFENGMQQRGLLSQRQINKFKFTYKKGLLTPGETTKLKNEITAFFNARNGSFDNFFLPSWQLECKSLLAITAGDSTFKIDKDPSYLEFSQTSCQPGNYIYITKGFPRSFEITPVHEVKRISSWAVDGDNWEITIDGTFSNSYPANVYIQKAYKVFFTNSELPFTNEIPFGVSYDLEFTEDLASLYELSL